ncbi:MAG: hypothetical protein P1P78_11310 [Methyloprofundus sp.]|nr:hypothetical protein [Methyloprofundus sp.]
MSTLSAQQLEPYLKEYELHLTYWAADDGDGCELLGCRELLEQGHSQLSVEAKERLSALDQQANKLLKAYHGVETFDLRMLKKAVHIGTTRAQTIA